MRIKGNKPKRKSTVWFINKTKQEQQKQCTKKKRAFARIQTYSLTAPCTWNQLWDYFATWLLNDVIALQTPSHHTYTNISGPTKFASCYDSRAIRTRQNYKFTPQALWPLLCENKFEHWILFCPPSGIFSRWYIATILLCFVNVVVQVFRSRNSFKWKRSLIFLSYLGSIKKSKIVFKQQ